MILIETLHAMPIEQVMLISPQSKTLRTLVKVPMLMMILNSAMFSGLNVAVLKFTGELIQSESFTEHLIFPILLLVSCIVISCFQMHSMAQAMKYYD